MTMNNIKWIFFDLDGTLVDNIPELYRVYINFLKNYGIKGNKKEFERLNGPSLTEIISILKNKYHIDRSSKRLFADYLKQIQIAYKKMKPKKHSRQLLDILNKNGYKLALVTSSPRNLSCLLLKQYGWKKFFKHYVFGDDIFHSKPHPSIYKVCLKKTKAIAKQTLVIEDSKNGFKSATKAGLKCVLLKKNVNLYNIIKILNNYERQII